ncbi:MAG: hypothetical protein HKN21_00335 [Candidatus Eisenbacteria bacterium]|uniref:DUF5683 domain-containing protein n=1 Tax=Eiseniibacteriota bacterium TaxID=2212470 RepID=A0A7Y2H0Q9_UNCEI|nr:hypothetical protein [Candidatus Eisenbacteria bacterium]
MILPGWGQVTNRAWLKAVLSFGAYAGILGWAVALNQDKQDAVGQRNLTAGTVDESFWIAEVARLEDSRNAKYWQMGLVMLLSAVDAYVDANLYKFDERIDADVALSEDGTGFQAKVTVALEGR